MSQSVIRTRKEQNFTNSETESPYASPDDIGRPYSQGRLALIANVLAKIGLVLTSFPFLLATWLFTYFL
jgi:hypothetical protein